MNTKTQTTNPESVKSGKASNQPADKADKPAKAPTPKADPNVKTPEMLAAEAKAEQKKADMLAKQEAKKAETDKKAAEKAAKEAGKEAAAKAKAEAKEAGKEAAAKAKAEAKEAADKAAAEAKAELDAKRTAALAEIETLTKDVEAAKEALKTASDVLAAAKRAARVPVAGDGTTAILRARAASYVHDKEHKTESGNASVHCDDATAKKLLGRTLDEVYVIAAEICEDEVEALRAKYSHLNTGMQRMNLGNKIRGVLNAK